MPNQVPTRLGRAGASAVAAVGLGAAGHALGGGTVGVDGLALALLLVAGPSWMLAGRERGWMVIAGVQVVAQQVMHPLLAGAGGTPTTGVLPHDVAFHLHVLGALATALWLRTGERRLWAAARRLAARVGRWCDALRVPPAAAPAPLAAVPGERAGFGNPPIRHAVLRRGPPPVARAAPHLV